MILVTCLDLRRFPQASHPRAPSEARVREFESRRVRHFFQWVSRIARCGRWRPGTHRAPPAVLRSETAKTPSPLKRDTGLSRRKQGFESPQGDVSFSAVSRRDGKYSGSFLGTRRCRIGLFLALNAPRRSSPDPATPSPPLRTFSHTSLPSRSPLSSIAATRWAALSHRSAPDQLR